jgi:hypothetical protein
MSKNTITPYEPKSVDCFLDKYKEEIEGDANLASFIREQFDNSAMVEEEGIDETLESLLEDIEHPMDDKDLIYSQISYVILLDQKKRNEAEED